MHCMPIAHLHCSMARVCHHCIGLMVVLEADVPIPVQLLDKLLVKPELDVSKLLHVLLKVELDISRRIHLLLKVKVELSNISHLLGILELDISNLPLQPSTSTCLSQVLSKGDVDGRLLLANGTNTCSPSIN